MSASNEALPLRANRLLAKLPAAELEVLRPHMEQVALAYAQTIIAPDEPIKHAYFPLNALLSLVTIMADGSTVESGTIGREGMAGAPVLLNAGRTPMQTLAQIPGQALRMEADKLKELYERGGAWRELLNRYMHTVIVVGSQSAACNRLHRLEERFCRWLLMSSDGIGADEIPLTQEFLATMLGTRRAGVTEAAVQVQAMGLISYTRGRIQILDREGLEAAACECYRRVKDEYERLLA